MVEIKRKDVRQALHAVNVASVERTQAAAQQAQKRRSERKAHKKEESIDFGQLGEIPRRVENSADVERWFKGAMALAYPDVQVAKFLVQEQVLCKSLLKQYEPEVVQRELIAAIMGWGDRASVRDGFHPASPTIALLWKMRQEVFGGGEGRKVGHRRESKQDQRERLMRQGEWNYEKKDDEPYVLGIYIPKEGDE